MDILKKPWYKRWWAIILFIFLGLYFIGSLSEEDTIEPVNSEVSSELQDSNEITGQAVIAQPLVEEPSMEEKTATLTPVREERELEDIRKNELKRNFKWTYKDYEYEIIL